MTFLSDFNRFRKSSAVFGAPVVAVSSVMVVLICYQGAVRYETAVVSEGKLEESLNAGAESNLPHHRSTTQLGVLSIAEFELLDLFHHGFPVFSPDGDPTGVKVFSTRSCGGVYFGIWEG